MRLTDTIEAENTASADAAQAYTPWTLRIIGVMTWNPRRIRLAFTIDFTFCYLAGILHHIKCSYAQNYALRKLQNAETGETSKNFEMHTQYDIDNAYTPKIMRFIPGRNH